MMIGIVIPYFQREAGILRRALESVLNQQGQHPYHIYIVDDGSPAPAEPELEGLPFAFREKITTLTQPNGGPAAARNRGLDSLASDIDVVAFLDSDDVWQPLHLTNACKAIAAGADFYFAEYQRPTEPTIFQKCSFVPGGDPINATDTHIRWVDTRALAQSLLVTNPIGTPTVALRCAAFEGMRFPNVTTRAGEDQIFWRMLLSKNPRVAACDQLDVVCGEGVNIFSNRSWGDVGSVRTYLDMMKTKRYMLRHFEFDAALVRRCEMQCRQCDHDFWIAALGILWRRNAAAIPLTADYVLHRPAALLRLPGAFATSARALLRRRARNAKA